MAHIPEETIEEIKHATDIVGLIGAKVALRRSGANYTGLCPFHTEKTPSFNVSPGRQSFKCFGCGEGGSAITFLMKMEGLHFVEAAKQLAEKAGIPITEDAYDPEMERRRKRRGELARLHNKAAEWYHRLLMRDRGPGGERVRSYLKGRGIDSEVSRSWLLGYAPAYDNEHRKWAEELGATDEDLIEAGIFGARGDGQGGYPRFRDRLMFPVRNDHGDVIAFSGRLLDPEAKMAKYLNSPETPLFVKSRTFFGLDRSKRAILKADRAIVCEGQLDLITAFEHGVENVVAALGTAFTEEHAKILKRHAAEVVICFDADPAGYKAAVRTFGILAEAGLTVRAARMPEGQDPDTLIREQGVETFSALLAEAPEFYDFQIEKRGEQLDLNSSRDRARLAEELAETVARIPDRVLQDGAIDKLSLRLSLEKATFQDRVTRAAERQRSYGEARERRKEVRGEVAPPEDEESIAEPTEIPVLNRAVAELCRLALEDAEAKAWLMKSEMETILSEVPESGILQKVWLGRFDPDDAGSVGTFLANLEPDDQAKIRFCRKALLAKRGEGHARALLTALEQQRLRQLMAAARAELRDPALGSSRRNELLLRLEDLDKEFLDL